MRRAPARLLINRSGLSSDCNVFARVVTGSVPTVAISLFSSSFFNNFRPRLKLCADIVSIFILQALENPDVVVWNYNYNPNKPCSFNDLA
jgi:hypothetical protein